MDIELYEAEILVLEAMTYGNQDYLTIPQLRQRCPHIVSDKDLISCLDSPLKMRYLKANKKETGFKLTSRGKMFLGKRGSWWAATGAYIKRNSIVITIILSALALIVTITAIIIANWDKLSPTVTA